MKLTACTILAGAALVARLSSAMPLYGLADMNNMNSDFGPLNPNETGNRVHSSHLPEHADTDHPMISPVIMSGAQSPGPLPVTKPDPVASAELFTAGESAHASNMVEITPVSSAASPSIATTEYLAEGISSQKNRRWTNLWPTCIVTGCPVGNEKENPKPPDHVWKRDGKGERSLVSRLFTWWLQVTPGSYREAPFGSKSDEKQNHRPSNNSYDSNQNESTDASRDITQNRDESRSRLAGLKLFMWSGVPEKVPKSIFQPRKRDKSELVNDPEDPENPEDPEDPEEYESQLERSNGPR